MPASGALASVAHWKAVMKWCRLSVVQCFPDYTIPSHKSYQHEVGCVTDIAASQIAQELQAKEAMTFIRMTATPTI